MTLVRCPIQCWTWFEFGILCFLTNRLFPFCFQDFVKSISIAEGGFFTWWEHKPLNPDRKVRADDRERCLPPPLTEVANLDYER